MSAPCHNTAWTIITVIYEVTIFLTDHTSDLTNLGTRGRLDTVLRNFSLPSTHTPPLSSSSLKILYLYSVRPVLMTDREYRRLTSTTSGGDLTNRHEIGLRFE